MAAALGALNAAVDAFCGYIEGLPEAALADKAWGPKEVLAHLVYWQEIWVAQAEAILAQRPYTLLRGRYEDVNAEVVRASRGVPVGELLRRFRDVRARLLHLARAPGAERLQLRLKVGATLQPLVWLISAEAEHVDDHRRTLERQAARDAAAEAEGLRQAVEELCGFVTGQPAGVREGQARAALAHLAHCFEVLVAEVEAVQAGAPFALPQGQALEAQATALAARATVDELLVRLRAAAQQLGRYGEALDPQRVVLAVWRLQMRRGTTYRTLDDGLRWLEAEVRKRQREWARCWDAPSSLQ